MLHCPYCDSEEIRKCVDGGYFEDENGDQYQYKCVDCEDYFNYPCEEVNE